MWDTFGVPVTGWDELLATDVQWMTREIDRMRAQEAAEARKANSARG